MQHVTWQHGLNDTCLYRLEDGRFALVQLKCDLFGESWVEVVELTAEQGRQFGRAMND